MNTLVYENPRVQKFKEANNRSFQGYLEDYSVINGIKQDLPEDKPVFITFLNVKGGAAKTTLAYAMYVFLANVYSDRPILLIDLDSNSPAMTAQFNTLGMNFDKTFVDVAHTFDFNADTVSFDDAIYPVVDNLYMMPSDYANIYVTTDLLKKYQRSGAINRLFESSEFLKKNPIVVVDSGNAVNFMHIAVEMGGHIVVPTTATVQSIKSYFITLDFLQSTNANFLGSIIVNKMRTNVNKSDDSRANFISEKTEQREYFKKSNATVFPPVYKSDAIRNMMDTNVVPKRLFDSVHAIYNAVVKKENSKK